MHFAKLSVETSRGFVLCAVANASYANLCKSVQICSMRCNHMQPVIHTGEEQISERRFPPGVPDQRQHPPRANGYRCQRPFQTLVAKKSRSKQTQQTSINIKKQTSINSQSHSGLFKLTSNLTLVLKARCGYLHDPNLCWDNPPKKNEPVNWHIQIGTLRDAYKTIQDQDKVLIGHTPCYLLLGCFRSSFSFSRALNILNLKSERTLWKHLKNVYITFIYSIFKKLDTISQSDSDFFWHVSPRSLDIGVRSLGTCWCDEAFSSSEW